MELKRPGNKGRSLDGTDSTIGRSDRHITWVSYNTLEPDDDHLALLLCFPRRSANPDEKTSDLFASCDHRLAAALPRLSKPSSNSGDRSVDPVATDASKTVGRFSGFFKIQRKRHGLECFYSGKQ